MKGIVFKAQCEVCNWESGWCPTPSHALRAGKEHYLDNPHRDYEDIQLFEQEKK